VAHLAVFLFFPAAWGCFSLRPPETVFVDEVKIYARAGRGGRGCVAFLREAFRPKGGPIGGDGGRGGSVILVADEGVQDLTAQFYQPRLIAQDGEHGKGKGMHGRAGKDRVARVPCGTVVWRLREERPSAAQEGSERLVARGGEKALAVDLSEAEAGASGPGALRPPEEALEFVADLTEPGQRAVLCRGGRGGLGNRHFATPRRQAPRFAQPGEPGEEGTFLLELRVIADLGLVGYPNAGKSTLLAALSRARPKIAPYPFTTLYPHVGVVEYEDWFRLRLCDVPGLIQGASENVGLGHAFLRHIRRCRALLFVLDTPGSEGRKPWEDYAHLLEELRLYDAGLLDRPRLVVANKMDQPEAAANLESLRRRLGEVPVAAVSGLSGEGLDELRLRMRRLAEGS